MTEKETTSPMTGFTQEEMKGFVRNYFEDFVNRRNVDIDDLNFAPEFVDHGADVPPGTPPWKNGHVHASIFIWRMRTGTLCFSEPRSGIPAEAKAWCISSFAGRLKPRPDTRLSGVAAGSQDSAPRLTRRFCGGAQVDAHA